MASCNGREVKNPFAEYPDDLVIKMVATNRYMVFYDGIDSFDRSYSLAWDSVNVYGRQDAIQTYQSTGETISLSWPLKSGTDPDVFNYQLEALLALGKFVRPLYGKQNDTERIIEAPLLLIKYRNLIVEEYRHDQEAYTQGLEIYNNFLFESTGLNGKSSVRKINMKSGEILDIINLDYEYFGEGLTILNDRIYQLTWKNRIGFIYDLDLNKIATFNYKNSQEGWGLCNDGEYLYKSDGTSKIWRLNPNTLEEIDFVDVMTDKSRIKNINELEFIDGKIYANTYQFNRDVVIVINPSNGVVEKVIDFSGIRDKVLQTPDIDVMNGIAYNRGKIFVTGKNWNKVFEVKVYSKN